jgi:hypothetical protein
MQATPPRMHGASELHGFLGLMNAAAWLQVALYGLLLETRYNLRPLDGLLWYSSQDNMERSALRPEDLAGAFLNASPTASHNQCSI